MSSTPTFTGWVAGCGRRGFPSPGGLSQRALEPNGASGRSRRARSAGPASPFGMQPWSARSAARCRPPSRRTASRAILASFRTRSTQRSSIRCELETDAAPARLVNVALHEEIKGLDVLLRRSSPTCSRRAVLTSLTRVDRRWPSDGRSKRLAAELGIDGLCPVPRSARLLGRPEALRAADLFVLSSPQQRSGPQYVIEALCTGLPDEVRDGGGRCPRGGRAEGWRGAPSG